jgi:uncharacterized membrane protein
MEIELAYLLLVVVSTFFGAAGGFVFKKASENISFNPIKLLKNRLLILGFILFGISAMLYIVGLSGGQLNVLYPVTSITYILSTILAKKYLGERVNVYKWAGIGLIILGSVILVR